MSSRRTSVFFNDTATTEIYTLSLHDALPIWTPAAPVRASERLALFPIRGVRTLPDGRVGAIVAWGYVVALERSEEHTSELQSRQYLVCRLLLEKKNRTPAACPGRAARSRCPS